jgi:membrane protein
MAFEADPSEPIPVDVSPDTFNRDRPAETYQKLRRLVYLSVSRAVWGVIILVGAALNAALAGRGDRQLQQGGPRDTSQRMSEPEDEEDVATVEPESVDYEDLAELRSELERFEEKIEDRTVHRDDLEAELKRYVRSRTRRGHARGWGPYLVLLYGTAMTLGAFYFLSGVWAILAMLVVWLSTLGLYALMVIVGVTITSLGLPGKAIDRLRDLRS